IASFGRRLCRRSATGLATATTKRTMNSAGCFFRSNTERLRVASSFFQGVRRGSTSARLTTSSTSAFGFSRKTTSWSRTATTGAGSIDNYRRGDSMETHPDSDAKPIEPETLKQKAARMKAAQLSSITAGAAGERPLCERRVGKMTVRQMPDDEHGVLCISV